MANPSSAQPQTHIPALDEYHLLGGNCLYLHGEGGETHSRITTGRWLRDRQLRSEFFIASQVCHDDWDSVGNRPIDRFTPAALSEDIARDLDLIGIDRLDLITLADNPLSPVDPVIDAVAKEIKSGRIGAYALSSWHANRILASINHASSAGIPAPAAIFTTELSLFHATTPLWPEYPPFSAAIERIVIENRLAVFAHVDDLNLGFCLLAGEFAPPAARSHWIARWQHPENPVLLQRLQSFAAQNNLTPREVILAWILHRPFPVFGVLSLPSLLTDQSKQYERACEINFQNDEFNSLRSPHTQHRTL
jgi:aryl-alcohol dehydrogenase-like predicted oxidoreductase